MNSDERFAIAQALYGVTSAAVKTRTEGNLRAEADRASVEMYAAAGSTNRDLVVNGAKVGTMRVETKSAWHVVDADAYESWCRANDAMDGEESMDWTRLDPDTYWEARTWLKERCPELFVTKEWPRKPDEDWLDYSDGAAIDQETGEVVPGLEFVTEVTKTVVSGCKWDESQMTKAERKKFAPVSVAVRGLPGGAFAALMEGGE